MKEKTRDILLVMFLIIAFFSLGFFSSLFIDRTPKTETTISRYNINISKDILKQINEIYSETDVEFCACLDGELQKNSRGYSSIFYIDKINKITYGDDKGVVCSKECSFAQIHSHPQTCHFSPSDIVNFQQIQKSQGTMLYFLMCPKGLSYMMWNDYTEVNYD